MKRPRLLHDFFKEEDQLLVRYPFLKIMSRDAFLSLSTFIPEVLRSRIPDQYESILSRCRNDFSEIQRTPFLSHQNRTFDFYRELLIKRLSCKPAHPDFRKKLQLTLQGNWSCFYQRTLAAQKAAKANEDLLPYTNPRGIRDQANRGTCTAFACLNVYENQRAVKRFQENGSLTFDDFSRHFLYYFTKTEFDRDLTQDGATLDNTLEALREFGVCREELCIYEESTDSVVGSRPSAEAVESGRALRITASHEHSASGSDMVPLFKELIDRQQAIFCAIPVFSSWANDYVNDTGDVPDPLGPDDKVLGYHAIALVGYNDEFERFIFKNSWTHYQGDVPEGWASRDPISGYPGYGTLSYFYVENYCSSGHTIDNFPIIDASLTRNKWKRKILRLGLPAIVLGTLLFYFWPFNKDKLPPIKQVNAKQTTVPFLSGKSSDGSIARTQDKKPVAPKQGEIFYKNRKESPDFYFLEENQLHFKVFRGNSVYQLEKALALSQGTLQRYNRNEIAGKILKAGIWLRLPLDLISPYAVHLVKKGETLADIAELYQANEDSIAVFNHIWWAKRLLPGEKILVLTNRRKL